MKKFLLAACAAMILFPLPLRAEDYPARPITIVVPFAAGGPTDVLARIVMERMRAKLGQTIVIENVTGAGGSLGVGRVVRSPADGYTVSVGHVGTHVVNGAIYPLSYDLVNDLEPVASVGSNPMLVVTRKNFPADTLAELVAWLKANPGKASAGTAGAGSGAHFAGIFLQSLTGTQFNYVPYRGTGPAMQDLVAGQIDLIIDQASNSIPQLSQGTIKALAVTADKRLPGLPDVPTVDEAGLPGFHVAIWSGYWVPKGTPKKAVAKLSAAIMDALADPSVRERLAGLGLEIPPVDQQSPQALGALQQAEVKKWWPMMKAANVKPD